MLWCVVTHGWSHQGLPAACLHAVSCVTRLPRGSACQVPKLLLPALLGLLVRADLPQRVFPFLLGFQHLRGGGEGGQAACVAASRAARSPCMATAAQDLRTSSLNLVFFFKQSMKSVHLDEQSSTLPRM